MAKVCIARVDRIGDLILTLPIETFWKKHSPQDSVIWLVNENLKFVIERAVPEPKSFYVRNQNSFFGKIKESFRIARLLTSEKVDQVIGVHVPWWIALAFVIAHVPKRIGAASQWFSFVFYNNKLRQKRSQALKHESEYNIDLAAFALGLPSSEIVPVTLAPDFQSQQKLKNEITSAGANLQRLVVLHPGMAGSALNWPPAFYLKLAQKLVENNVSVVVTGSATDRSFVQETGVLEVPGVLNYLEKTTGKEMISLLSLAKAVVVPSTGVAHLAASLGVPVVGIYSPVKVEAPLRWQPIGKDVKVFVGAPGENPMEQIPVDSVLSYVMSKL